jgi:hypothetical protein
VKKEISDNWNIACNHLREAENAQKIGDDQKAKEEALNAMLDGYKIARLLLDENSTGVAEDVFMEKLTDKRWLYAPSTEIIKMAKDCLQQILNLFPPEITLPPPPV